MHVTFSLRKPEEKAILVMQTEMGGEVINSTVGVKELGCEVVN
jgi:hypothetical protein